MSVTTCTNCESQLAHLGAFCAFCGSPLSTRLAPRAALRHALDSDQAVLTPHEYAEALELGTLSSAAAPATVAPAGAVAVPHGPIKGQEGGQPRVTKLGVPLVVIGALVVLAGYGVYSKLSSAPTASVPVASQTSAKAVAAPVTPAAETPAIVAPRSTAAPTHGGTTVREEEPFVTRGKVLTELMADGSQRMLFVFEEVLTLANGEVVNDLDIELPYGSPASELAGQSGSFRLVYACRPSGICYIAELSKTAKR